MPFIEFEGKNVERAVTRACEVLNIPRDQLKHDVISFGATGIFGLVGIKKARIRVIVPGVAAPRIRDAGKLNAVTDAATEGVLLGAAAEAPVPQPVGLSEPAALGKRVLQRLADSVTGGTEILVNCSSRQIVYTISGGDPATLIGKRGQTLEAIQYLLKKIVNKSVEDSIRIVVDVPGYALKRQNDLQALALQVAEKACRIGNAVTAGRFNPQDRKIIHLALKNDRRVKTQSRGEGYVKKLAVIPRGE